MTDPLNPATPTEPTEGDQLPAEEETIETGAWSDKQPDEQPSDSGEPPEA